MIFSDLHIHSSYSDGTLNPREIINLSTRNNLSCISITDHDSILSQRELKNLKCELNSVPGIELSSEFNGHEIHLLGYFIDIDNTELNNTLASIHNERIERIGRIIRQLNSINIDISYSEIEINKFVSIGRPHIAKLLIQKGYVSSIKEAFQMYLAKGKPGYIERYKINYKEALKLLKNCGGISVLAHPGEIYKGLNKEKLIKELKIYGLDGIEVFHPSHNVGEINSFYNISKKFRMVITGGSDYHGTESKLDINIGTIGLDENLTSKFFNYYFKQFKGNKNTLTLHDPII